MKIDTKYVESLRTRVDKMESIYGAEITVKALIRACDRIIKRPEEFTWYSRKGQLPYAGNESGAPTLYYSIISQLLIVEEKDE